MSNYSRGANFERRIKKYYESRGWFVFRSAGSRSPVDLLAMRAGEFVLIQAKMDGRLSALGREQLAIIAKENCCQAYLVYRNKQRLVFEELGVKE